jgi:hypothetical protein
MSAVQIAPQTLKEQVDVYVEMIPSETPLFELVNMKDTLMGRCRALYAEPESPSDFYVMVVGLLATLYRIQAWVHKGEKIKATDPESIPANFICAFCHDGANDVNNAVVDTPCGHYFHVSCMKKVIRNGVMVCPRLACGMSLPTKWTGEGALLVTGPAGMVGLVNTLFTTLYPHTPSNTRFTGLYPGVRVGH